MLLGTAKTKRWDMDYLKAVSLTRQPSCVMETGLVLGSRTEIEPHAERVESDCCFRQELQTLPFAIRKPQDMQIGIRRIWRTHIHQKWKPQPKCHSEAKSSQKNLNLSVIFSFYNMKDVNMQIWDYFLFSHLCIDRQLYSKWFIVLSRRIFHHLKCFLGSNSKRRHC